MPLHGKRATLVPRVFRLEPQGLLPAGWPVHSFGHIQAFRAGHAKAAFPGLAPGSPRLLHAAALGVAAPSNAQEVPRP